MSGAIESGSFVARAWGVLTLFLIPIGGGIPAGVLLARDNGILWPVTAFLYLISDVVLACVLEPTVLLFLAAGKRVRFFAHLGEAFRKTTAKTTARFGTRVGPLALIAIAFGVDPMTGRAAAAAAGHGFVAGWAIAITGDMIYFALLMVSTLWLNSLLGDGTLTTVIIMVAMFVIPEIVRRVRGKGAVVDTLPPIT